MGPLYVATAKDTYAIVKWSDIVTKVYDAYSFLLAEMFGYNLAAAHLGLCHIIANSFAMTDIWSSREGWPLIDNVPAEDMCHNVPQSIPPCDTLLSKALPGKMVYWKVQAKREFISCEAPLLKVTPADLALKYTYAIMPGDNSRKDLKPKHVNKYVFMICTMIDALNLAARYYEDQHCEKEKANYDYSYTFFSHMSLPEDNMTIAK